MELQILYSFIHILSTTASRLRRRDRNTRKKYCAKKKNVCRCKKKILFYRINFKIPIFFFSLRFSQHTIWKWMHLPTKIQRRKKSCDFWSYSKHISHSTHWLRVYLDKRIKIKNSSTAFEECHIPISFQLMLMIWTYTS